MKPFHKENTANQLKEINRCGTFLAIREHEECTVELYNLSGFFVEVWLHPKHVGIYQIKSFKDLSYIDPYLAMIDISAIYQ